MSVVDRKLKLLLKLFFFDLIEAYFCVCTLSENTVDQAIALYTVDITILVCKWMWYYTFQTFMLQACHALNNAFASFRKWNRRCM